MNDLMDTYKTIIKKRAKMSLSEFKESQEEEMNILTDLEFLVHQIDNAQEFVKNGLTDVVFPSLNSTSSKVRYEATKLLGSAVQSNPTAQITALELGTVSVLLRSLSIDASPQVKSGALYALSCLVRRFPAAQARLVERGGLTVFSKIFQSETGDILKLQVKVVTFVNDLILEKRDTEREVLASSNKSEEHMTEARERLRQYNTIGLERRLKGEGWCKLLIKLLQLQDVHREDSLEEELRYFPR
ncbi:hypothetical protein AAG570_009346 [Ranatra chinensis]|uniref:Nucleotide exchange factor SIL1 n=1 Tax=Ranatra chinensis TaxID=642074 RepID=A0ABD0YP25_9HEMI